VAWPTRWPCAWRTTTRRPRPRPSRLARGQAAYEAIEQARIEAIGANALGGVRENLAAALEARLERKGLTRDRTRPTRRSPRSSACWCVSA
jgi:cobalamin biosynthesis protein CobT